jgi:hypothetical protein
MHLDSSPTHEHTLCLRRSFRALEPPMVHDMTMSSKPKRAAVASSPSADSSKQTLIAKESPSYNWKELKHVVRDRLLDTISKSLN